MVLGRTGGLLIHHNLTRIQTTSIQDRRVGGGGEAVSSECWECCVDPKRAKQHHTLPQHDTIINHPCRRPYHIPYQTLYFIKVTYQLIINIFPSLWH